MSRSTLGVDGWSKGWVGVELRDGRFAGAMGDRDLASLIARASARVVAVDIPLGLLDSGWRAADLAARKRLGRRASCVFLTPPRAALAEESHAAATAVCAALNGQGFSIQAWGLRPKIAEANRLRDGGAILHECHPEVTFSVLGLPDTAPPKKTWAGHRARLRLLADVGIALPDDLGDANAVPVDDVVDAAAAAWTAARIAAGVASSLPDSPQADAHGRPIAISY